MPPDRICKLIALSIGYAAPERRRRIKTTVSRCRPTQLGSKRRLCRGPTLFPGNEKASENQRLAQPSTEDPIPGKLFVSEGHWIIYRFQEHVVAEAEQTAPLHLSRHKRCYAGAPCNERRKNCNRITRAYVRRTVDRPREESPCEGDWCIR